MDILDANVCYEEASINSFISGYSEQRFVAMQSLLLSNVFLIYFSLNLFWLFFVCFFICFFGYLLNKNFRLILGNFGPNRAYTH